MVEVLYVSWRDVIDLCYKLAKGIAESSFEPDVIVAVLRGGVVPALLLSDILGVEEFYAIRVKHWGIAEEVYITPVVEQLPQGKLQGSRVLIVDEVADTGKTLIKAIEEVKKLGAVDVKTAVLHLKSSSSLVPDYYAAKLEKWVWIFYPWSLAETLFALAYKELGTAAGIDDVLKEIEELVKNLEIEHYRRDIIEAALRFYIRKKNQ
ncbi:MAG: phosphoribosyltransferase [Ignisphaera sp.]|uniref:Phosphoribosyltransferase n=1 Tax=Ignisphaera aggregans TaxID=334771 RepID=A0A7C4JJN0_9CREN